jgi:hypothetical protein
VAATRVIRIDDQVWAELQKLAAPLADTPNSVLRRVFGLPVEKLATTDNMDSRVVGLLEVVGELVGQLPQVYRSDQGYSFVSGAGNVVAYIRSQDERLRITAGKRIAEKAGLMGWSNERGKSKTVPYPIVRWYASDGDSTANEQIATVLATLWRHDAPTEVVPFRADSAAHPKVGHLEAIGLT